MRLCIQLLLVAFTLIARLIEARNVHCEPGPIDLVLVVDESNSVKADFQDSRVGMVLFNDVARVGFPLTTYATNFDVTTAILGMNFNGGISNIAAGMHTAMTESSERGVQRVMVIITDGMDITDVGTEHALASKNNINTYVLGIGEEQGYEEMVKAAGDPSRLYDASNFTQLRDVIDEVCNERVTHGPRECGCNYRNTWLDLIFIVDSSKGVNEQDFYASFDKNVDAAEAMRSVKYLKSDQVNLRDALVKAQNIIADEQRPNVQKVVVIFSSKDEPCYYQQSMKAAKLVDENACRIAANLRENNNIILTVRLKFDGTERFPILKIASDCYSLDFDINFSQNFINAICRANCYCLKPYVQFTDQCTEYGECVYQHGQPLGYLTARQTCSTYNATIADVLSKEKDIFLSNMQEKLSYNPYWIGVENTATSGYTWSTGIVVSFIATSLTNMIALLDWIRNQHI
uniref:VWFA domain-containing protein n=1 Tax=Ascaris lumbricoides TaxID=6252 RepID=A0A9J2PY28_ASCLU